MSHTSAGWGETEGLRKHWRELGYWIWWWRQRVPIQAKLAVLGIAIAGLLGGGWLAADRLTAASAGVASAGPYVLETTVQRYITVREKGKIIRKLVPVVKRVKVFQRRETAYETRLRYATKVVTLPGSIHTVRRVVTTVVPVVKRKLIKVNGKTYTVVTTRLVPTTRVETVVTTETREVTNQQTVTNTQNVTQPGQTITDTKTKTQTQTQTQTQTETKTVTQTDTVTETKTVTEVVTETVTA